MHRAAVTAGALRAASGISFLVAPEAAQRLWSDREASDPTARLLLRSMGYRDALIGGGLLWAGWRDAPSVGNWFLASAGADAADFVGGMANKEELSGRDHVRGIGGAAVGIALGVVGWLGSRRSRYGKGTTSGR